MTGYTKVFSLGAWCQVADQLKLQEVEYVKGPLEWTVTPLDAVIKVLDDEGKSFGLNVERVQENHTVECQTYGLLHHHDYPRNEANENKIEPITDEAREKVVGKFQHKMRRFLKDSRAPGRKLFIRLGGEAEPAIAWPYLHDATPVKSSRINALVNSIERFLQNGDFDLAFIYYPAFTTLEDDEPLDRRVKIFVLAHPSAPDSRGDVSSWKPIFETLGLLPRR